WAMNAACLVRCYRGHRTPEADHVPHFHLGRYFCFSAIRPDYRNGAVLHLGTLVRGDLAGGPAMCTGSASTDLSTNAGRPSLRAIAASVIRIPTMSELLSRGGRVACVRISRLRSCNEIH